MMPQTHAVWAAYSEAYAELIAEHLHPGVLWLDAGCGSRLLEEDLNSLEDWLVERCGMMIGMDLSLRSHRNIRVLVQGSLYALPFADNSLDLVTCNMVMEHLEEPARALSEVTRCLRNEGLIVIQTPYLPNYGVLANAIAAKIMPETWRLRLVHSSDDRQPHDVFPVHYRANTFRRLRRLLSSSGLEVQKALALTQNRPFLPRAAKLEEVVMKLKPTSRLLVCARKVTHPVTLEYNSNAGGNKIALARKS